MSETSCALARCALAWWVLAWWVLAGWAVVRAVAVMPEARASAAIVAAALLILLPLAMRAVEAGHDVTGYDTDLIRVKRLEAGESYVEDVPAGELAAALESGQFRPSASEDACAGFDVAVITVPTPLRDGLPDLGYVEAASRMLARYLRPGATVILESTSYPGTTQEQVLTWLEDGSGLAASTDFHLGYSPERIDPGNRTWTLATTPKIVSGIDGDSLAAVENFYRGIVAQTWRCPRRARQSWPSSSRTPSGTGTSR